MIDVHSRDLPAADRFEWWRDLTYRDLVPTRLTSERAAEFRASATKLDLGPAQVSMSALRFSTLRSERTPRLIRHCDPEMWMVGLVRGGELGLEQERNTARYAEGDLILYDTSRPFVASVLSTEEPARVVLLQLPRATLPFPEPSLRELVARRLPAGGPGALLGSYLRGLAEQAGALGAAELDRLGSAAIELAAAFFAGLTGTAGTLPAKARAGALRRSIRDHVVRHLHDGELSPATIARAHHISVRYLHLLFRQDGQSIGAFVREQRLDRCRTDLADPRLTALSVAEIGARWGFGDGAVFSRTFKKEHGVPPGEYRRQRVP